MPQSIHYQRLIHFHYFLKSLLQSQWKINGLKSSFGCDFGKEWITGGKMDISTKHLWRFLYFLICKKCTMMYKLCRKWGRCVFLLTSLDECQLLLVHLTLQSEGLILFSLERMEADKAHRNRYIDDGEAYRAAAFWSSEVQWVVIQIFFWPLSILCRFSIDTLTFLPIDSRIVGHIFINLSMQFLLSKERVKYINFEVSDVSNYKWPAFIFDSVLVHTLQGLISLENYVKYS